jgi:hypothetical protein
MPVSERRSLPSLVASANGLVLLDLPIALTACLGYSLWLLECLSASWAPSLHKAIASMIDSFAITQHHKQQGQRCSNSVFLQGGEKRSIDFYVLANLMSISLWIWALLATRYDIHQRSRAYMGVVATSQIANLIIVAVPFGFHISSATLAMYNSHRWNTTVAFFLINAYFGCSNNLLYLSNCLLDFLLSLSTSYLLDNKGLVIGTWTTQWISELAISRLAVPLLVVGIGALVKRRATAGIEPHSNISSLAEEAQEATTSTNASAAKPKGNQVCDLYFI